MRVLGMLGIRAVVLTNAARGVHPQDLHVGELVHVERPHQHDGMEPAHRAEYGGGGRIDGEENGWGGGGG